MLYEDLWRVYSKGRVGGVTVRRVGHRCLIRITGFGWASAGPIYFMIISTTRNDNCNICCDL